MKCIADQLPPEIARQLHPDRRKNEETYGAVRDQLLEHYRGQWIGFADGRVIASGTSPVTVFHKAEATGLHPFFICVGREEEPCRIRRVTFSYDAAYPGEPLPITSVEFRRASGAPGCVLDRVVPDTDRGRCRRPALGRLSTPGAHSEFGRSSVDQWRGGEFAGIARFPGLGRSGRARLFVSLAGGLDRQRTHPGPRCPESFGDSVSRSCRGNHRQSVTALPTPPSRPLQPREPYPVVPTHQVVPTH